MPYAEFVKDKTLTKAERRAYLQRMMRNSLKVRKTDVFRIEKRKLAKSLKSINMRHKGSRKWKR